MVRDVFVDDGNENLEFLVRWYWPSSCECAGLFRNCVVDFEPLAIGVVDDVVVVDLNDNPECFGPTCVGLLDTEPLLMGSVCVLGRVDCENCCSDVPGGGGRRNAVVVG